MSVSVEKSKTVAVPWLQAGDRLSRPEFERRFDATPNLKKAELLEGMVYMPPPVSDQNHSQPHFDLITWLGLYRAATSGVVGGDNGSLRLDLDNEPQPDAYLRILTECGGQSRIDAQGYVEGAPELVAEVAANSVSYDLHVKLNVYRRHGVREYIVWRVLDEAIDWFVLREGEYERHKAVSGVYRSEILPGLWLDAGALIGGELSVVERVMREGVGTTEHSALVARLRKKG